MRRRISRRKRRYILGKGAEILHEGWITEPGWDGKAYEVRLKYLGWTIYAADRDELGAYNAAIACFPSCEEEPFVKENV